MIICSLSIAPRGCFRVVGVDIVNDERYIVGDYTKRDDACAKARTHNSKRRKKARCRDDLYFVYDDEGHSVPL